MLVSSIAFICKRIYSAKFVQLCPGALTIRFSFSLGTAGHRRIIRAAVEATRIEVIKCSQCGRLNTPPTFISNPQRMTCDWCHGVSLVHDHEIQTVPAHTYWAVHCQHCYFINALAEAKPDAGGTFKFAAKGTILKVDCPVCYHKYHYERPQVFLWTGPPPAPDFRPHPGFQ